jgi:RIO kinase 2
VSSAQQAAKIIRELELEDWTVLKAIEGSMLQHESIPISRLQRITKYYPQQLEFRLSRLNYWGFVMKSVHGYVMNTAGLDLLALHSLVEKGLISGLGQAVGMGKESDVFDVQSDSGEMSVVKFYRIGRTSFRSTRKSRTYVNASSQHQWLSINIGAAQKEAEGLTRAIRAGVNVPRFIARDRHAVLMSKIDGIMLNNLRNIDVEDPGLLLNHVFANMKAAYTSGKMVNGDISEFNILYDGEPWIIDWPQYVPISHPNSEELLKRDISKPSVFFRRRFGVNTNEESAFSFVTGKSNEIKIS